jgi:hypothetical protein
MRELIQQCLFDRFGCLGEARHNPMLEERRWVEHDMGHQIHLEGKANLSGDVSPCHQGLHGLKTRAPHQRHAWSSSPLPSCCE